MSAKIAEDKLAEVIIDQDELQNRIEEMGREITDAYEPGTELRLVCILRGAVMFMADLSQSINMPVTFDFMEVSSYAGTESTGTVRIIKDLEDAISGEHVLIVEDIIDTGLTLRNVVDMLKTRKPASIKVATLLDKPERRDYKHIDVDFNGFEIPDKFVVGYGLDYEEKYRNLPFIGVLEEDEYN